MLLADNGYDLRKMTETTDGRHTIWDSNFGATRPLRTPVLPPAEIRDKTTFSDFVLRPARRSSTLTTDPQDIASADPARRTLRQATPAPSENAGQPHWNHRFPPLRVCPAPEAPAR